MRGSRVVIGLLAAVATMVAACGKSNAPASSGAKSTSIAPDTTHAAPGNACPATGKWAVCSVVYRLERAGLAPKIDSGATPEMKSLGGEPLMLKIGMSATLELHLYPDSAARAAATSRLNRADFVSGTQEQSIRREKTLIESVNLVGFLTSINGHQRERVSDALTAGPPQP